MISETFNTTINLVAAVTIPALSVTVTANPTVGRVDVVWLLEMMAVCIAQLA